MWGDTLVPSMTLPRWTRCSPARLGRGGQMDSAAF